MWGQNNLKKINLTDAEITNRPVSSRYGDIEGRDTCADELFRQEEEGGYYLKRPGLLKRIFSLGLYNYKMMCASDTSKEFEPSFWKVLRLNIKG